MRQPDHGEARPRSDCPATAPPRCVPPDDRRHRARQILPHLRIRLLEPLEVGQVDPPRDQRRVVQSHPLGVARVDRPEAWRHRVDERASRHAIQRIAERKASVAERLPGERSKRRVDRLIEPPPELGEPSLIGPARRHAGGVRRIAPCAEERLRPARPDEVRERLIERHRILREVARMGQFMEHRLHDRGRVPLERGVEHRVLEPPERAEGRRRSQVDIKPRGPESRLGARRLIPAEESLVRHPPDDGEPPGHRDEPIPFRGGEHQHQGVAPDIGVLGEGPLGGEPQSLREGPGLQDQLELPPGRRVHRRIRDQDSDRLPPPEDPGLLPPRPDHEPPQGGDRPHEEPPDQHAEQDPPPPPASPPPR